MCLSGGLTHGSSCAQNARLPAKRESRCLSHGVSHRVPTLSLPQSPRPAPHILSSRHHGLAPPSVEALDHIQDRDGAQKATGLGEELDLGLARRRAGQRCRRPRAAPTSALATWCCVVTIFGQPKLALVAVSGESRMTPPSVHGESRMPQPSTYTPCLESHAQLDPARTHGIIDVWWVVTEALCRYPHSLPTSALTQQVWAFRSHTAPCALCPHCGCPCLSALHVVCSSIRGRTPASTGIMFAANLIGPGDSDRLA